MQLLGWNAMDMALFRMFLSEHWNPRFIIEKNVGESSLSIAPVEGYSPRGRGVIFTSPFLYIFNIFTKINVEGGGGVKGMQSNIRETDNNI